MPVTKKQRQLYPGRTLEPVAVRRARQSIEGSQAMTDYLHMQAAVRERMAVLREERLPPETASKTRDILTGGGAGCRGLKRNRMALRPRHAGAFGDLGKTDLCVRQQEAVHPAAMRARHMHQVQSGALKRGVIDVNAAVDVALMRRALEVYLAHSEILAHGLFSSSSQYCSVRFQTVNSEDC